ncbi:hypothetical protein K9M59_02085 [Candidatus Gracilibacteria bacterium]|nr:hypothetical protein [Candidatus Gracilibacteria bacterium]MCF7819634.1 hypothetical protein [Candidatus Gracilibacteria bacterium]
MKKLSMDSYAKINLTLDVFPKKSKQDFHEIKSVMHKIALADEIEIQESKSFSIDCDAQIDPEYNLVKKAFELVQKIYSKKTPTVSVQIKKNIPIGSGLGGGSSNFATFVELYHELFQLGPVPDDLIRKSAEWGKDIPFFFITKSCALVEHFGEKITPLPFDFHNKKIFLYCPDLQHPTAEKYAQLKNFNTDYTDRFLQQPALSNVGNGFDEFFQTSPYQAISNIFPSVHITGSGSCFWGLEKKEFRNCETIETRFL